MESSTLFMNLTDVKLFFSFQKGRVIRVVGVVGEINTVITVETKAATEIGRMKRAQRDSPFGTFQPKSAGGARSVERAMICTKSIVPSATPEDSAPIVVTVPIPILNDAPTTGLATAAEAEDLLVIGQIMIRKRMSILPQSGNGCPNPGRTIGGASLLLNGSGLPSLNPRVLLIFLIPAVASFTKPPVTSSMTPKPSCTMETRRVNIMSIVREKHRAFVQYRNCLAMPLHWNRSPR
mmetsp:Transcript_18327/g.22734  ORF Transcript_18327/g.22734 Transcript_18327/m.22734 type:complete len:236 (-) Transcript_18327:1050-1757(-)